MLVKSVTVCQFSIPFPEAPLFQVQTFGEPAVALAPVAPCVQIPESKSCTVVAAGEARKRKPVNAARSTDAEAFVILNPLK